MPLSLPDRLKLARDDYDQQEKLYNSLVLGQRFYIGIVAVIANASIKLTDPDMLRGWDARSLTHFATTTLVWASIALALYHLSRLILGEPWANPRSVDHYFAWKAERLKQLASGQFDTGTQTPEEFADDEMLCEMANAYADSTNVNREGNLSRQRRVQLVGKSLIAAVIALGLQGGATLAYSWGNAGQRSEATPAPAATCPASGYHRPQ